MAISSHLLQTLISRLLLLIFFYTNFALSQTTTYYVQYNSTANANATGTLDSPFTSINQAATTLGVGTFELLLLQNSVYLTTSLTFPASANYTIRPAALSDNQTYFPFYINPGCYLAVKVGSVTIKNIQLIDLDTARPTNNPSLRVWQNSILNLEGVLFADIKYSTSYNHIMYTDGTAGLAQLNFKDCEFRNLTNARMQISATQVSMINTVLSNITQTKTGFMCIFNNINPSYNLAYQNVSITNSNFTTTPSGASYGFLYVSSCAPNILWQDFTLNNIWVSNKVSFFTIIAVTTGLTTLPVFTMKNVRIQNMFEVQVSGSTSGLALFQQIQGLVSLDYTNFTVDNLQLQYAYLIQCLQVISTTVPAQLVANVTWNHTVIQNSISPFFFFEYFYNIILDNMKIYNTTYSPPYGRVSMFLLGESGNIVISNFEAINNTGCFFDIIDIFNQTIQNWNVVDLYVSTKWSLRYPFYLTRVRDSVSFTKWSDQMDQAMILMNNITINGYYDIDGLNSTNMDTGCYATAIISEYGLAYLTNSVWYNFKLSNFGAGYTNHLQIDNLTVDSDPSIPFENMPVHTIFKFGEIRELNILNSRFMNQQNAIILILFFLHRSNNRELVTQPDLLFENLTVVNNIGCTDDFNTPYPSLFDLRTPLYPVVAAFKNSYFYNNTVVTSVLLTDESLKCDVDYINNTFINNIALTDGGAISAMSMEGETSIINIINNTFINNTSLENGGVYYFLATQHNITATDNIYINNSAQGSGGVGYFSHAYLTYTETNGTYFNNSASVYGGAWFLSMHRNITKHPQVFFFDTSFEASSSEGKGGAIYLETGDVYLQDTTIKGSSAQDAGGDVYIVSFASITMERVNSTGCYSPKGAFMFVEATTDDTMTLRNVRVTDVSHSVVDKTLLVLNAGGLIASDSVFKDIYSPLFQITSGSVKFLCTSFSNIYCKTESTAFCIFQGSLSNLSTNSLSIENVTSNQNLLVVLKAPSGGVTIQDTTIANVNKIGNRGDYSAVVLKQASNVTIQRTNFTELEFSGITSQNSSIKVLNSRFSNAVSSRILRSANSTSSETRFIVLTSSNSSISDTSFITNSLNTYSLNGGAILINGTSGNHNIAGSSFQDNHGINGGAISIQGTINSLNIEESEFINNVASQNGGSIYFIGQGSSVTPTISQTTFEGNEANTGGAIYINNSPLMIRNSVFESNSAESGAAIASLDSSSQTVSLIDSIFRANSAQIGAALMTIGDLNFDSQTSVFTGNTAEYGGDTAGRPHHLYVKVYQVSETFLYLDDISDDYIISHYQTVLVYDSQNTSLQNSLVIKPGRIPNYFFEFQVVDELNQHLSIKSLDINLTTTIVTSSTANASSTSSGSTLFGTAEYSFNESINYIFNSFYITSNFYNHLQLSANATVQDIFSNQTYTLPLLGLPITVGICSVGETYDSIKLLCNPCKADSYSIEDPFTAQSCEKCPATATCLGGDVMYPNAGYWRINATSDNFIACPNTAACLGGEGDGGKNISLTGLCGTGYEGIGCGTCTFGYVNTGLDNECISCSHGYKLHIRYVAFLFIRIGLIMFSVGLYMNNSRQNPKKKTMENLQMSVLKVIVDFMQVISPVVALHTEWPTDVREFLDIISSPTSMYRNNFSMDCIIASIRGTNQDLLFIKTTILLLQPAFFIAIPALVVITYYKITGRQIRGLMINMILITVITGYICQPDILQSIFQLFRCENFGSSEAEQYFLIEDTSVECWGSHHVIWILGLAVPALIIWLILPVGIFVRLLLQREKLLQSEAFHKKYDMILETYNSNMFYWELIILARKLLLIIASLLSSYAYLQTYLGFAALIVAYLFQRKFEPYSDSGINIAESISIFSSAAILYTGLYFVQIANGDTSESFTALLFAADVIAGVVFFGYCAYLIRALIKKRMRKLKKIVSKSLIKSRSTKKLISNININLNLMSLQSQDFQENQESPENQSPHLLNVIKPIRFDSMSFSPRDKTDTAFPSHFTSRQTSRMTSRLRRVSTKIPETLDLPLRTEPPMTAMTGGDEIDKLHSPRNHSMVFESEADYHLATQKTTGNLLFEKGRGSCQTQGKHIFSLKSVESLFNEIDDELQENKISLPDSVRQLSKITQNEAVEGRIPPMPHFNRKTSKFSTRSESPTSKYSGSPTSK